MAYWNDVAVPFAREVIDRIQVTHAWDARVHAAVKRALSFDPPRLSKSLFLWVLKMAPMVCTVCGKTALYRVGMDGYCRAHLAQAKQRRIRNVDEPSRLATAEIIAHRKARDARDLDRLNLHGSKTDHK